MTADERPFWKRKTTWAAIVTVVTATGAVVMGEATIMEALEIIIPAILALFVADRVTRVSRDS